MADSPFTAVRVARRTVETDFAIRVAPRTVGAPQVELPNRILAHFLDHLSRGAGVQIAVERAAWPQSWEFDHVLCADMGQLIGPAFAAIAVERTAACGIAGRAVAGLVWIGSTRTVTQPTRPYA